MSRLLHGTILGLVALTMCLSSDSAQAQTRWGVSIGNGGGVRVGVGSGFYGPGYYGPGYYRGGYYGPGYRYGYAPPPVVIAPQPVIVPQPTYIQPQPTYVPAQPPYSQPQQYGIGATPSPPSAIPPAPAPSPDGGEILLFSPATNTADIRYNLNGRTYTMRPGTKQKITNDRVWTIQFEPTPGQAATYTLHTARYKFKSTDAGITLHQTQDSPEVAQPGLPPAPTPEPPEAAETVIPSRSALRIAP